MDRRLARPPETDALANLLRRWILEQAFASGVGHIGSALSITDIVAVLWRDVLRDVGSSLPDRDRFILGKGHAALALYAALRWQGLIDADAFQTYCGDGSLLGVHPEFGLPSVEVGTGSLGQALSVACGIALALQRRASPGRVFTLVSDAECNEGQLWEAVMFAAQQRLTNLIAIVDLNGLQAMGETRHILDLSNMADRWRAFGWHACEVDGHDERALRQAFCETLAAADRPGVVIARTVLGKGVGFMENRVAWHYQNLSAPNLSEALHGLGDA